METELTKTIKRLTHYYKPKLNSQMRTIRWADEVWTPTGIVDSIRFEDYCESEEYLCRLIHADRFTEADRLAQSYTAELGVCMRDHTTEMDEKKCHGCVRRSHLFNVGMIATCFEVKITYSDFKSQHGHNFHGNENYYVVPKELAPIIEPEVPADIGILSFYSTPKSQGLRMHRKSGWRDVDDGTMVLLLYNAMKKWCDGAAFCR